MSWFKAQYKNVAVMFLSHDLSKNGMIMQRQQLLTWQQQL